MESTGRDLYTAMATESETRSYIDSVLVQRDIVETVEVFDSEGHLVFRNRRDETRTDGGSQPNLESPALVAETVTNQVPYEIVTVPVGTVGTFQIGISRSELQQRLVTLRRELLRQTAIVAVLTVALFVAGYPALQPPFEADRPGRAPGAGGGTDGLRRHPRLRASRTRSAVP